MRSGPSGRRRRTLLAGVGSRVVDDRWPGEGPLGGVLTALLDVDGDVVVAACDLPDLDARHRPGDP